MVIAERMQIGRESGDLEFADNAWCGGIGELEREQRIDLFERDQKPTLAAKTCGERFDWRRFGAPIAKTWCVADRQRPVRATEGRRGPRGLALVSRSVRAAPSGLLESAANRSFKVT